jgi:AcrR family transcriptional regulator
VQAAVGLLDEHGLEGLTMRKLGASLHVTAPTLYWHVQDREEVLDLAYDAVFGELPTADRAEGDDWRPAARRSLVALRAMVIRHPWWAQLRPTRPAVGPEAMRVTGGLVELLVSAGVAGTALDAALTLMTDFAVGATATSVQFRRWLDAPAADIEAVRAYVVEAAIPWPAWSTHIATHLVGSDPDQIREETFTAAIEALLAGVASLAGASTAGKHDTSGLREAEREN